MKRLCLILLTIPSLAYASDEEFHCEKNIKNNHSIECKANKDGVAVKSILLNGGNCESAEHPAIHHRIMHKGDKFTVPGSKECGYVAGVTVNTHSGKSLHFNAM